MTHRMGTRLENRAQPSRHIPQQGLAQGEQPSTHLLAAKCLGTGPGAPPGAHKAQAAIPSTLPAGGSVPKGAVFPGRSVPRGSTAKRAGVGERAVV